MKREVLFRGKRKSLDEDFDGEWVEGDLFHNLIRDGRENELRIGDIYFDKCTNDEVHGTGCWLVYPETVGQYTDLCDKNGKKIFEGDIVKCAMVYDSASAFKSKTEIVAVEYIDGCFYPLYDCKKKEIEVIGNIYDNPELLTDKK